jgi:hypothetical protein
VGPSGIGGRVFHILALDFDRRIGVIFYGKAAVLICLTGNFTISKNVKPKDARGKSFLSEGRGVGKVMVSFARKDT